MPRIAAEGLTEGETRLDKLCEEYLQRGLRPHPRKTFRKVSKTECLGALIDGETGLVRSKAPDPFDVDFSSRCFAGICHSEPFAWISILQVLRRMFCLLDHLYQAQQGRSQESVIALSGEAKSEIWSLCALRGIAVADLRAQSHRELFLFDASEEFTAPVTRLILARSCLLSFTVIAWPDKLAQRRQDCRYVLGADSQVALAVICKGRSSSPALNTLLKKSLPNLSGSGLYGSYGFVPSLRM